MRRERGGGGRRWESGGTFSTECKGCSGECVRKGGTGEGERDVTAVEGPARGAEEVSEGVSDSSGRRSFFGRTRRLLIDGTPVVELEASSGESSHFDLLLLLPLGDWLPGNSSIAQYYLRPLFKVAE